MRWINVKTKLPADGQEVYYFSPILGLWRGKYIYSPTTHSIDEEGNQHPVSEKLARLISPHVFIGGGGCCDTDEVTHWQPYDAAAKKREAQGWVPLPPNYGQPDMADFRDFHDSDEEQSVQEVEAARLLKEITPPSSESLQMARASKQPEWLQAEEISVDPPSGWRYGFPKVWNRVKHPDMTQWLIDNGYPETEAKRGLPVRFIALSQGNEAEHDCV